jgi:hypothetical protein
MRGGRDMSKKVFTDDERIRRVWDVIEIKNVMGRHAYYHAYHQHQKELDEIWVKEPENAKTASFGQSWGYQVGMDMIRKYYGDQSVEDAKDDLKEMQKKYPDLEMKPENYGVGQMLIHQLTSPYIEIAADGKTAQGLWYAPGQVTVAHPDSVDAMWMYERYGVDFVKENGEWKMWHMFVGTDWGFPAGNDFTKEPIPDEPPKAFMPETYEFEAYTSRYNYMLYPAIPEPYDTFTDPQVVSNGPEGNPNFAKNFKKEG